MSAEVKPHSVMAISGPTEAGGSNQDCAALMKLGRPCVTTSGFESSGNAGAGPGMKTAVNNSGEQPPNQWDQAGHKPKKKAKGDREDAVRSAEDRLAAEQQLEQQRREAMAREGLLSEQQANQGKPGEPLPNPCQMTPRPAGVVCGTVGPVTGFGNGIAKEFEHIETYPNIEAPDTIAPEQQIAVQVSLSAEQIAPETIIQRGEQKNGKLVVTVKPDEEQAELTVNVSAPGLEFAKGSNSETIELGRDGNSTIAAFYMKVKVGANGELPEMRETKILATLWHEGAFVARLARPITIVAVGGLDAGAAPHASVARRNAGSAPVPAGTVAPARAVAASIDLTAQAPDLTIMEHRVGDILLIVLTVTDRSGMAPSEGASMEWEIHDAPALHTWIEAHFAGIARAGRGLGVSGGGPASLQAATDALAAFGNELADRILPADLHRALYGLMADGKIRSIQVCSDDPAIPWELMRLNGGAGKRSGFLGETVSIARWPLSGKGLLSPVHRMQASESYVVAPQYAGGLALPETREELDALLKAPTFRAWDGTYAAVRKLATSPPPGIVHFAGHGQVSTEDGVTQYRILLQDGAIGPEAWAALSGTAQSSGTLYFFNACDVGEAGQFMNEVDGWAPALLGSGASGYIGALWPISDATANVFAATFYQRLALELNAHPEGVLVSSVLEHTRATVYAQTKDPTALSYVFYGDPELRLVEATIH